MNQESEQLLRVREAKLLEWILLGPDASQCTTSVLDIIQDLARRLLIMQTSRGEICHILSPARQRKLSIAECSDLNVHLNTFYLQLVKGLENLVCALQLQVSAREQTDQTDVNGCVNGDLVDRILRLNLRDSMPTVAVSFESRFGWLTELHARDPCRLSNPLYVLPAAAEEGELEILRGLETELAIAAQAGDFREYRQKIGEAHKLGTYFPLLASRGADRIHLWPLPQQVIEDAEAFLSVAEPVFFVFQHRTA